MSKEHISARLFENNINPARRAETLTIEKWQGLSLHLSDII